MILRILPRLVKLITKGEVRKIIAALWFIGYKQYYEVLFWFDVRFHPRSKISSGVVITVETKHPIAFASPDHLVPVGTKYDNSSHKKFLLHTEEFIGESSGRERFSFLDLGCSGGQLVRDFLDIGWISVGLEGSDYSLKHKRANWPKLAGKNLFTCDITKPFSVLVNRKKHRFHLITAWEVLEHINALDLPILFKNIMRHLVSGGYFMASTTSLSDVHRGVDLHQTKRSNRQWRIWLSRNVPELFPVDDGLAFYERVRYNSEHSYLVYQKK